MIRGLAKSAVADVMHWTGAAAWLGARPRRAALPLVLGYHRVVEDFERAARGYMPSMLTSVAMLEQQLDWIGRHYDFADPDEMGRWLDGAGPGRKPVALVSFDDGYRDVHDHALPLLKRKGIPALVFVVSDLVGTSGLQLHDELYLLLAHALPLWHMPRLQLQAVLREAQAQLPGRQVPDPGLGDPKPIMRALFSTLSQAALLRVIRVLRRQVTLPETETAGLVSLDWPMLAAMRAAGLRIGSHTCSHALLTNELPAKVEEELRRSRRVLEEKLGAPVHHFAYPDGRFDAAVVQAAADAGYRYAYTTCRHRDSSHPALSIPRRLLWQNACLDGLGRFSPAIMSCQVNGVFDFAVRCGVPHAGGVSPVRLPAPAQERY